MQQDIWTNTITSTTYGITGPLGSPRGWLRRALNVANLDDTTFHETSITPPEISVAGIWYRPAVGLPETGAHRELIRWFEVPDPENMTRSNTKNMVPAIGIAAAVPMHEVLFWIKEYKKSGAAYTWWKTPANKSARVSDSEKPKRRQLDHAAIYEMLELGLTTYEIAKRLDIPGPNIDYVKKKWLRGDVIGERKAALDVGAIRSDIHDGVSAVEVAAKYNTSESYVYRMMRGIRKDLKVGT